MTYSAFQIYKAAFYLIEIEWKKNKHGYLGAILGDMSFTGNGSTADPTMWYNWLNCLYHFKPSHLSEEEGLEATIIFLKNYQNTDNHKDIDDLVHKLENCLINKCNNISLWNTWLQCLKSIADTINYQKARWNDYQAFKAAQLFLANKAHTMESVLIESIYKGMSLDNYGYTKDPSAWNTWKKCLKSVSHDVVISPTDNSEEIIISTFDAFKAFILFMEHYYNQLQLSSLAHFLEIIYFNADNFTQKSTITEEWIDCFARLNNHQARLILYGKDGTSHMP